MRREDLVDLNAFLAVAEEQSFTRAAARLGTSQSALSYTVRRLETRLGVRLLTRTTRRVAATEAGERLIGTLRPALEDIGRELDAIGHLREKPAGTIRITAATHAAKTVVWPALSRLLPLYPDINVEISVDAGFTDIVAERFDAGVRLGESVAKDMVAVRVGPDLRMAVAGSPAYFAAHGRPMTPQDLTHHDCINLRLRSAGALYAWELGQGGRELRVRVEGRLIFNEVEHMMQAAREGFGLICILEDHVQEDVAAGRLEVVLQDWCEPFSGYHLYYPSRRQPSAAFSLLVETLRYRGEPQAEPRPRRSPAP